MPLATGPDLQIRQLRRAAAISRNDHGRTHIAAAATTPTRTVIDCHQRTPALLSQRPPRGGIAVPDPELLTLNQVAERLQVSRWIVYQLIWSGDLPSVHLGRCHRIRTRDFDKYVECLGADS